MAEGSVQIDSPLATRRQKLRIWLPVVFGGLLVMAAGLDQFSWANTEPLTRPLISWFYPELHGWDITLKTYEVRKVGHVVLYGCLATLLVRVIASEFRLGGAQASLWAFSIVSLLAMADESLQSLRPSRQGTMRDVVIDIAAAALALAFYWWGKRVRSLHSIDRESARRHSAGN